MSLMITIVILFITLVAKPHGPLSKASEVGLADLPVFVQDVLVYLVTCA